MSSPHRRAPRAAPPISEHGSENAPERKRGRPPKAETEALVLTAARELEAEVGYERASIEAIAERAGVAKTGIYRRWPNKGFLMFHAVLGMDTHFAEVPDTGDIAADLFAVVRTNAAGMRDPRARELITNLMAECARDAELARLLRERFFGPRADAIVRRVEAAVERGELAPTIDATLVPALLTGPFQYLMVVRGSDLDDHALHRLVDAVVAPHLR
jgi:AcrR family transcriptional regulator